MAASPRPLSHPNPLAGHRAPAVRLTTLPTATLLVARGMANDPEWRMTPVALIAQRRRVPLHIARAAAAAVLGSARRIGLGQGLLLAPAPELEPLVDLNRTMDQLLATYASNAAPPVSSPSPSSASSARRVFVPHPAWLGEVLVSTPGARRLPMVRAWFRVAKAGEAAGFAWGDAGALMDAGELFASDPSTQWLRVVKSGEGPRSIANFYTKDELRFVELLDANPEKERVGTPGLLDYNFKRLLVGEKIKLPKAWNVYIADDGTVSRGVPLPTKPGVIPTPTEPTPGAGDYVSTLPFGSITATKLALGKWAKEQPSTAYGGLGSSYPGPLDVNDVVDESFTKQLRAFQTWYNATKGGTLNAKGILDAETDAAVKGYVLSKPDVITPGKPDVVTPPKDDKPPAVSSKGGGGGALVIPLLGLALAAAW